MGYTGQWGILHKGAVERLIEHEAKPSATYVFASRLRPCTTVPMVHERKQCFNWFTTAATYCICLIKCQSRLVAALELLQHLWMCAEQNTCSRPSQILAVANIQVAHTDVNKSHDSMAISKQAESLQELQFKDCRKQSIMHFLEAMDFFIFLPEFNKCHS